MHREVRSRMLQPTLSTAPSPCMLSNEFESRIYEAQYRIYESCGALRNPVVFL